MPLLLPQEPRGRKSSDGAWVGRIVAGRSRDSKKNGGTVTERFRQPSRGEAEEAEKEEKACSEGVEPLPCGVLKLERGVRAAPSPFPVTVELRTKLVDFDQSVASPTVGTFDNRCIATRRD